MEVLLLATFLLSTIPGSPFQAVQPLKIYYLLCLLPAPHTTGGRCDQPIPTSFQGTALLWRDHSPTDEGFEGLL